MECELSPHNAFLVDKLLNVFPYTSLTISTTAQNMTLQLIHIDSTVIMTITLLPMFFDHFHSKPSVFTVGRQKLHTKNCTKVMLKSSEYKFTVKWLFAEYEHKREFYISDGSLYHIKFEVQYEIQLNIYTMYEIIKYYSTKNTILKFDGGLSIVAKEQNTDIFCKIDMENEFVKEVEMITNNLKRIFSISDICDSVAMNFEEEDKTVNFVFQNTEMIISIFTATYT